VKHISSN